MFNNAEAECMLCHNAIEARETMQNSVGRSVVNRSGDALLTVL